MMLFTNEDMQSLFPSFDPAVSTPLSVTTVKTFLQIATGHMNIDMTNLASLLDRPIEAVPLEFMAAPAHSFGKRLTDNTPVGHGDLAWSRKIPRSVYDRVKSDHSFGQHLGLALYECWKPVLLAELPVNLCTNCATNEAVGFVTTAGLVPPDGKTKLIFHIGPAWPVCRDLICNARLREFVNLFQRMGRVNSNQTVVICRQCDTTGGPEMQKCGRCKVAHYCSRDCQVKDWANHKLECRKISKSELSLKK